MQTAQMLIQTVLGIGAGWAIGTLLFLLTEALTEKK